MTDSERNEAIQTLRERLNDPSLPEDCILPLQSALTRLEYYPRKKTGKPVRRVLEVDPHLNGEFDDWANETMRA